MMFCSNANQSLGNVVTEDFELKKAVMEMKEAGILEENVQFLSRRELSKWLIDQQGKIKAGQVTSVWQREVLDRALTQLLGRSIFY